MTVIDSPLVVYREPDPGEDEFPYDVKNAFYKSLSEDFKDVQVIIFENDVPPADIESANVILFTGNSSDRYGFLKTKAETP